MTSSRLLDWSSAQQQICALIAAHRSQMKIVLKTKDDIFFLPRWVEHHRKIVGEKSLVIFDNGSTNPAVLDFYAQLDPRITVARFSGFHNNIHNVAIFPALYAAIRGSCDYYSFLDTDEYLTHWLDGRIRTQAELLTALPESGSTILPGMWLYNYPGSTTLFQIDRRGNSISNGVLWGKPIIGASLEIDGFINHNCQCPRALFSRLKYEGAFIILHLAKLSTAQRIQANLNKLQARRFDISKIELNRAYLDSTSFADQNIRLYLEEILHLRASEEYRPPQTNGLLVNTVQLNDSGELLFHTPEDKAWFEAALTHLEDALPA